MKLVHGSQECCIVEHVGNSFIVSGQILVLAFITIAVKY